MMFIVITKMTVICNAHKHNFKKAQYAAFHDCRCLNLFQNLILLNPQKSPYLLKKLCGSFLWQVCPSHNKDLSTTECDKQVI